MKKQLLFATLGLLGAQVAQAQAQLSVGAQLGLQSTSFSAPRSYGAERQQRLGGQAGIIANAQFNHFAIQPALLFSQKGDKNTWREGDYASLQSNVRLNYLELPVNFVLSTGKTEGFQLFAGPYVALGVGGRLRTTFTYLGQVEKDNGAVSFRKSSYNNPHEFRRFDAGFNVGIGHKCGPFQIQATYGASAMTITPEKQVSHMYSPRSRSIQLNLSYFLYSASPRS